MYFQGLEELVCGKSFVSPLYIQQAPDDKEPAISQGKRS